MNGDELRCGQDPIRAQKEGIPETSDACFP
jgi:hypothetical protein